MRAIPAFLLLSLFAPAAEAAVVVLTNATGEAVNCKVTVGTDEPLAVQLAVGESKPITCGRTIEVSFESAGAVKRLKLDPYNAYLFRDWNGTSKKKVPLELMTIELAGKSPGDRDIPQAVPPSKPLKVAVKLLVDNSDRRTRPIWTAALKKRLGEASEVMLRQAGVSFEAVDAEDWTVDGEASDLKHVLADFEKQVKAEPARLALAYTSRAFAAPMGRGVQAAEIPYGISRGMFGSHILMREGDPRTEPERVEALVAQLGRYLGAVASPDPLSAMRLKLGDGKAVHVRFKIGFDPLNVLAMNLVADQLRKGAPKKLADWPEETQVRLARIYATLSAATPEEPINEEVGALLERAGLKVAVAPEVKPRGVPNGVEAPKAAVGQHLPAEQEAIRTVVKAIVVKAEENAKKSANARIKGDELTDLYIRTAADVAYTLDQEHRKKAFLIALGIALDDSDMVRNNALFNKLWKAVESDDERKVRIAVLGNPTVRFRRDLCQHFAVSAAITAIAGPTVAETVGLGKEISDMNSPNGSGFDFSDLCGDFAGVELANLVLANGEKLAVLRQKFTVADYVPKIDDLADGLTKAKFKSLYGDTSDKRFTDAVDRVRKRVKDLKAYQTRKEN